MRLTNYFISAVVVLCGCAQSIDQSELRSEIEKANQEFMSVVKAKDAGRLSTLYTEDGRLMFPNMPAIEGRESIKGFFQQAIDNGISEVRLTTEEVKGTDEFAIETGTYEMVAGTQTADKGKYIAEWKKVGGKWHLHRDMPSTNMPSAQLMAKADQTVGIAVFKVKKGNIDKFEDFVKNILMPAADVSTPEKSQAIKSIRMLKGAAPEKDGTHKFIFIFDPYFQEAEYEIEKVLVGKHGPEKGMQLNAEFSDLVTPFYEYHEMKQLAAN